MCEQLRDRFATQQTKYTVNFRFITQFDPDDVVKMNPQTMVELSPIQDPGMEEFNANLRAMSIPHLSNCLKHCSAIRAVTNSVSEADDMHLVLEDDVCFSDNAIDMFMNVVETLPAMAPDWEIVFLGFPAMKMANDNEDPTKLKAKRTQDLFKILPGCDAYLLTKAGAAKLNSQMLPFKFNFNVQLSYAIHKLGIASYSCTPNVFIEGSKLGTYVSSLNTNNLLIYNQVFREMFGLVQLSSYSDQDRANFAKLWELTTFKGHPDFLYQKGFFLMKDRQFQDAKQVFEQCFDIYKKNACAMTKDTIFLNNYIELFKVIQDYADSSATAASSSGTAAGSSATAAGSSETATV